MEGFRGRPAPIFARCPMGGLDCELGKWQRSLCVHSRTSILSDSSRRCPSIPFVRKRPFADLVLGWFDKGAPSNPKMMASVAQMMAQAGEKDVRKVTRFIDEANEDYHWPAGKLISARNAGSKHGRGGGKLSWAANGTAVQDLH